MNERIKELAFEAMSINQKVSDDSFFVEVSKLKEFEKFAELIVRECAKISLECGINLNREDFRQGIARNIKERFGMEEE